MTEYRWSYSQDGLSCHHMVTAKSQPHQIHTHDTIELYYFLSGDCTYTVEGTRYPLKPHDILLMRPLESHRCIIHNGDVPYERLVVNFPAELLSALTPDGTLFKNTFSRPLGIGNRFSATDFGHSLCCDMLDRLLLTSATVTRTELLSMLLLICAEVERVLRNQQTPARSTDMGTQLIDYVNEHLFSPLSLEHISNTFFISQAQVNRLFKARTGSSVGRYISVKRLLTARDRIRSGATATEVCYACGYNDYSAFYRAYTKYFGVPPQHDKKTTVG